QSRKPHQNDHQEWESQDIPGPSTKDPRLRLAMKTEVELLPRRPLHDTPMDRTEVRDAEKRLPDFVRTSDDVRDMRPRSWRSAVVEASRLVNFEEDLDDGLDRKIHLVIP